MLQQELRAALQAELTAALGYEKGDPLGWGTGNNRNGEYCSEDQQKMDFLV